MARALPIQVQGRDDHLQFLYVAHVDVIYEIGSGKGSAHRFYPQLGIGQFAQYLGQTAVVSMGAFGELTVQTRSIQRGNALI